MTYDKIAVGNEIRRRRLAMGLSQEQASEKADLSLRFYARVELGSVGMSVDALMAICNALETTPDGIMLPTRTDEAEANRAWIADAIANCPLEKQAIAIDLLKSFLKAL